MKRLLLIAATTVALSTSALAEVENPFYVKLNGGGSWLQDIESGEKDINNKAVKFKNKFAPMALVGFGYSIMNNLRIDLTGEMIFNSKYKLENTNVQGDKYNIEAELKQLGAIMLNGYVDIFDVSVAGFFVGGGVGVSRVQFKTKIKITDLDGEVETKEAEPAAKSLLAYQATIGMSTPLSEGLTAEIAYSYRGYGKVQDIKDEAIAGHHASIGIRFSF